MTLTSLTIAGFKCFRQLKLPVAPLTVLSGFNASGKSTTLQSLLLMSQALRHSPYARHLPLNGPMVRLGTAGDVVARSSKGPIAFQFESEAEAVSWTFRAFSRTPVDGGQEEEIDAGGDRERLELYERSVGDDQLGEPTVRISSPELQDHELISLIRDVIYLGATRGSQMDVHPAPDDAEPVHGDVGFDGQHAAWWYVRSADETVEVARRHPKDERITVRAQVDAWLGELFPGAAANAEAIPGTGLARFALRMGRTSDWARPANIGYGLTYAFPLIVALLIARPGQIVVVDSPEAHLHPRAQSRMGQMLAQFASAGVQILIETHSDHILSGVRLGVRAKRLRPAQVEIHFFSGVSSDSNGVISTGIDEGGMLGAWPDGFFDQADLDLAELAVPQ